MAALGVEYLPVGGLAADTVYYGDVFRGLSAIVAYERGDRTGAWADNGDGRNAVFIKREYAVVFKKNKASSCGFEV